MKSKLRNNSIRIFSIALALVIAFSSAAILLAESSYGVALAKASNDTPIADANVNNDLTSGMDEVFLPNYDTEVITKTNLPKPTVATFGDHDASYYPSYTNQINDLNESKQKIILAENQKMLADVREWFAAGTLKDNLKKHVSADGQFSNAAGSYDDAPRIEKVITINNKSTPRKRSLGVFAPGGEVLTITIDESLVKAGLTVNIGYPYKDECDIGGVNDRWKNDRMAQFFLSFKLTQAVTYIGSPLGGMVSLDGVNTSLGDFDITISGGVDMPDYKLGVSTKEDWQNILAAPGPYVWLLTPHQYFVMPKVEIADIEDPYDAMLWWHKASMISMYSMAREDTGHFTTPVISVFDSYVYIGEGVAKVWAFVTNAPKYWCHGIVDYDNLMSNGAWGAIHEYNHHHQSHAYASAEWGVGGHDEITNNVVSALSYILLTDVAAMRSESNLLNGWGAVTDPYCNYKKLVDATNGKTNYEQLDTNKLFGFVDMMHTFGVDKFIQFLRAMYGYGEVEGYDGKNLNEDNYLTTQDGFTLFASLFYKTDFTDYFTDVWHFNISEDVVKQIQKHRFEKYFSITNLYSVGVKGIEAGRAFKVSADEPTVLKLDEYTLCSTDDYKLTKVSSPKHGKLTDNKDGTYTYTPNKKFTEDSFELTYKVKVGNKSYKRTLVVKLTSGTASETETNSYPAYVDFRNQYLKLWYSEFVSRKPTEIQCLDDDGNEVKLVNGANADAMFDGNTSTGFHTAWQGSPTAYPHNYYFTYDQAISFNRINFYSYDNGTKGYYAIGEYEIYTSDDGENYKLLADGINEETSFNVQLSKPVSAKYVKLVVKSNATGKNFTNITEIEFVGAEYNVYDSHEAVFNYDDASNWTDVSGNYVNGKAKHAENGKVSFYMTGTELMLYSTNAESKITIDGNAYTISANDKERSPSFVISGMKNKKHLVVIEGVDMTLDMIKISSGIEGKGTSVNWTGMSIAIVVGVVFIGTVTAFIVIVSKQKAAGK